MNLKISIPVLLSLAAPVFSESSQSSWERSVSVAAVRQATQAEMIPVQASAPVTIARPLTICVKAYRQSELAAALTKCQETVSALSQVQSPGVSFIGASCQANARGVAMGFVSRQCGVYDVVLQVVLMVSP